MPHPARILGSLQLALAALFLLPEPGFAQGGPPFRSDDPDTPGNRNWEVNLGFIGERDPSSGSYALPDIDINYGLGHRVQLKFELPLSVAETRGEVNHFAAGPGNSLLGVKWRFYAHHPKSERVKPPGERESTFGVSLYPQLMLNNPTRSVDREIAEPGPQFLLPIEGNAVLGPIRVSGELGYWFTGSHARPSWIRGVVIGREFRKDTELYLELFDQKETEGTLARPALRDSTLAIGGRMPVNRGGSIRWIGMAGRSLVRVTPANGQPQWIAYVGIQFLSSSSRRSSNDYMGGD